VVPKHTRQSTITNENDDLRVIFDSIEGGSADLKTNKIQLRSSVLDLTVTADSDNDVVAFCDFYYVYCRKDVNNNDGATLATVWATQCAQLAGGTSADVEGYGLTPFQTPGFCQYFLIQKVQRVSLTPGQTCSLMMKNNRLRVLNTNDVDPGLFARRGITRGLLCVVSGGPQPTGSPGPVTVAFNASRTYCLNVLEDNDASYTTI